jgi:hypothetical protein
MLKTTKKVVDEADVDRARLQYPDPQEFAQLFSYRKGNKKLPLRKPAAIARKLREIEGHPQFWDYADEEREGGAEE